MSFSVSRVVLLHVEKTLEYISRVRFDSEVEPTCYGRHKCPGVCRTRARPSVPRWGSDKRRTIIPILFQECCQLRGCTRKRFGDGNRLADEGRFTKNVECWHVDSYILYLAFCSFLSSLHGLQRHPF